MSENDLVLLTQFAARAEILRLFLDYDGTLAEFAPTPENIEPDQQLIGLIQKLTHTPGVLPALISGRRLADIEKLLPVRGLLLGGTYGLEFRLPDGRLRESLDLAQARPLVKAVLESWTSLTHGLEGFYLEDKGWTAALHGRWASEGDVEHVMEAVEREAGELIAGSRSGAPAFRLSSGRRFLEIGPELASKYHAVKTVLAEMTPPGAAVIYIGDDDRDEEAFKAVLEAGGYPARVTRGFAVDTLAAFRFTGTRQVRDWLQGVIDARRGPDTRG